MAKAPTSSVFINCPFDDAFAPGFQALVFAVIRCGFQVRCAIMDVDQYRYQKFISDLNGMDIHAHGGDPRRMVEHVRTFLLTTSGRRTIPDLVELLESYDRFVEALPTLAAPFHADPLKVIYPDFERLVINWTQAGL